MTNLSGNDPNQHIDVLNVTDFSDNYNQRITYAIVVYFIEDIIARLDNSSSDPVVIYMFKSNRKSGLGVYERK